MGVVSKKNLVATVRTYTDQQGQEKKVYKTIGELTTFEGQNGTFDKVELYHMPGVEISVFEPKNNDVPQGNTGYGPQNTGYGPHNTGDSMVIDK